MHAELLEAFVSHDFCDFTFALVRDPRERLISEYKMRKDKAQLPFKEWVVSTFGRYQKNPYVYDNHIRPQVEFVTKYTKVFKFEEGLSAPVSEVCDLVGQELPNMPHKRKSISFFPEEDRELLDLIFDFYREDYEAFNYSLS
ncbi:sulfotransferase family 2 domain-containing protein [Ruegeria sp. HKCCA5426]|uniref:sulfotransferase family 2 domain-containing protein n=1 Tax=Ruegeria sp. HKCCA5426 TaxID=2682985 RepID=UPI0014889782|nr:sulfotransferase family 2 domain-containing protein [Ruegeria sp. HKCCA5426]